PCTRPLTLLKPILPNLVLSASTSTTRNASIIFSFKLASVRLVMDNPNSGSIPSTPRKSNPQEICSSVCSAAEPVTDEELGLTRPPNGNTSTFGLLLSSSVTVTDGVLTDRRLHGNGE